MKPHKEYSLNMALVALFKQLIHICYSSVNNVLTFEQSLSVESMRKLESSQLCHIHMNRICNILEYLSSPKNESNISKLENFDSQNLFSSLSQTFINMVSDYIDIDTECYSKLERPVPILVNKAKFELLVLNILYCSLNNLENSKNNKRAKLTLYITETADYTVFHIRDNGANSNPEIIKYAFSDSDILFHDDNLSDSVIALSLDMACHLAKEMGGFLSYASLKTGNRYDIYISKAVPRTRHVANSLIPYIPTYELYTEVVAGIKLKNNVLGGEKL